MKVPKKERRQARQLFRSCLVDCRLDEERLRRAVAAVISRKPRGYLSILAHFRRLARLEVQRRTALVQSAVPLTPDLEASVRENLLASYGQDLRISFERKPDLVGGLRIRVGSDLYDGTISGRLAALAEALR